MPISLIEKRIVALEDGDLDSKLKIVGHDELAVLSKNFNTMVGEIKNLLKQKERLLSDVSHELRSPLAKIRLMLALMPEHKKVKDVDYLGNKLADLSERVNEVELSISELTNKINRVMGRMGL